MRQGRKMTGGKVEVEGMAAAARGRRHRDDGGEEPVAGARSGGGRRGGGTEACGGDGWTPSSAFLEQPLEREITPFFIQITARVCGGSLPLL